MKFIHTGDIHWGMCPDANKPWGKERAQAIKDTFRIIIEKTKEMDVDCLFISGDLFHLSLIHIYLQYCKKTRMPLKPFFIHTHSPFIIINYVSVSNSCIRNSGLPGKLHQRSMASPGSF